jgi:hypothetical protein
MSGVIYSKFQTEKGFASDSFNVDENGNIVGVSIDVNTIKLGGTTLFQAGGTGQTLPSFITISNLTQLGTLTSLTVEGNVTITDGLVSITSDTLGSLDNIEIGGTTPAAGSFTDLTATTAVSLTSVATGSMDNVEIGLTTPAEAGFTEVTATDITVDELASDNVTVNLEPTNNNHATRKDYVDRKIAAFSIAFGA